MIRALPVLLLLACAHAPSPLVITGETLHAAKLGMVGTEAGMRAANEQNLLTAAQRQDWNTFEMKFVKSWGAACDIWEAAHASQDEAMEAQANAIIARLLAELSVFTELLAEVRPADGGSP